jgi:hypothetical protein
MHIHPEGLGFKFAQECSPGELVNIGRDSKNWAMIGTSADGNKRYLVHLTGGTKDNPPPYCTPAGQGSARFISRGSDYVVCPNLVAGFEVNNRSNLVLHNSRLYFQAFNLEEQGHPFIFFDVVTGIATERLGEHGEVISFQKWAIHGREHDGKIGERLLSFDMAAEGSPQK